MNCWSCRMLFMMVLINLSFSNKLLANGDPTINLTFDEINKSQIHKYSNTKNTFISHKFDELRSSVKTVNLYSFRNLKDVQPGLIDRLEFSMLDYSEESLFGRDNEIVDLTFHVAAGLACQLSQNCKIRIQAHSLIYLRENPSPINLINQTVYFPVARAKRAFIVLGLSIRI